MYPIILKLGSLKLSSYGLMLAIAFLVGIFLAKRIGKQENVSSQQIEAISFWMIISGILGSRFLYTFVEHGEYYWKHPLQYFAFQKGGLSFFGGLFFSISACVFYCYRNRISFLKIADILTPSVALGLSIAKIGCFLAGCCHGGVCEVPWGVTFNHPETLAEPKGVPLHPVQLYEALSTIGIFFALIFSRRFRRFHGELFFFFLISYGVIRSFLETFRGHPGHLGELTTAQTLSIPMVGVAVVWWFLRWKKRGETCS